MSSRVRSEFGTFGGRVAAMTRALPDDRPVDPARHVWVKTSSGDQAGLLVAWVRGGDEKWWGKVAVSDAPGEARLQLVAGNLLTPASMQPEED